MSNKVDLRMAMEKASQYCMELQYISHFKKLTPDEQRYAIMKAQEESVETAQENTATE